MAKADELYDFESSELGTKQYWENAYDRELETFHDIGDIGEIWFGEDIQEKIVEWLDSHVNKHSSILDLGCGNGALLLELKQNGFTYVKGVDYAEGAVKLASAVLEKGGFGNVMLQTGDLTCDITVLPESSCLHAKYNVCIDKGTYDAISLKPEEAAKGRMVYRSNVHRLLEPDGFFLITSCNWTKEQLEDFFCTQFKLVDEIETTLFEFGGKIGRSVTSLIFSPV